MLSFVREGLRYEDPVCVVASAANVSALKSALGSAATRVDWRDATDHYQHPARTLAAYSRYFAEHQPRLGGRVRIIGEPVWSGLTTAEIEEWTLYESVINIAFAEQPAWVVCPYDVRSLDASIVANAHRTHPQLARVGGSCASHAFVSTDTLHEEYRNGRLAGEPGKTLAEISFDTSRLCAVRKLVGKHASAAGLAPERVDQLVLAVMEAISNVVRHGAGHGSVRVALCENVLICDVIDAGTGFSEGLRGYIPPSCDALSGRGLWIIRQVCDSVGFFATPGKSVVRMEMRLPRG
jgi:anti-sigma regulatory factor (Ser/Thr protein kinase)